PVGAAPNATVCTTNADCAGVSDFAACDLTPVAGQTGGKCVNLRNIRTTTAPMVSVIDTASGTELHSATVSLNQRFDAFYTMGGLAFDDGARRSPLFPVDLAFVHGGSVA